jgi:hypothetical protein
VVPGKRPLELIVERIPVHPEHPPGNPLDGESRRPERVLVDGQLDQLGIIEPDAPDVAQPGSADDLSRRLPLGAADQGETRATRQGPTKKVSTIHLVLLLL